MTELTLLNLEENRLSGRVPSEIGDCEKLKGLFLRDNDLSETIPEEIRKCFELEELSLRNNKFSGLVPKEISELKELRSLKINDNKLEGELPEELGALKSLNTFHCHNNNLSGSVPAAIDESQTIDIKYSNTNGNPSDIEAPIREEPIRKDRDALLACWRKMGGDLKILRHGDEPDHRKWKGVTVGGYSKEKIQFHYKGESYIDTGTVMKVKSDGTVFEIRCTDGEYCSNVKLDWIVDKSKVQLSGYRVTKIGEKPQGAKRQAERCFCRYSILTRRRKSSCYAHHRLARVQTIRYNPRRNWRLDRVG